MKASVVWLKRDLRLEDHQPLCEALDSERPLVLLYCFEPMLLEDQRYSERHWRFVTQSLQCMNRSLRANNIRIMVLQADMVSALEALHDEIGIAAVYSHEETGVDLTYQRDIEVAAWLDKNGIAWHEHPSNGIERGRSNRSGWNQRWQTVMESSLAQPQWRALEAPWPVPGDRLDRLLLREPPASWLEPDRNFQGGGPAAAQACLDSFFGHRGEAYARSVSSPDLSRTHCSRLSPYLAWGNLSIRQVYQALEKCRHRYHWERAMQAFESRLHWHCHFIQKFESECRMEFEDINRGFLDMPRPTNASAQAAWRSGHTGYPLIDASMRCLQHTGYINFRSRAMLVSFFCHHLWQHWRDAANHLASLFLDFEPGIHYAQLQMQAGVTGTNTVRIYNPVKQSMEHDPDAAFILEWVPELRGYPEHLQHTPWEANPMEKMMLPEGYPEPIVNCSETYGLARDRLWAMKDSEYVQLEAERILNRHVQRQSRSQHPARQWRVR